MALDCLKKQQLSRELGSPEASTRAVDVGRERAQALKG
jgi:hypothetical protein